MKLTAEELRRALRIYGYVVPEVMEKFEKELAATLQTERDKKPPTVFVTNLNAGNDSLAIAFFDVATCMQANTTTVASGNLDLAGITVWLTGTTRIATPNVSFNFDELGRSITGTVYFSYSDLVREIQHMDSTMQRNAKIIEARTGGTLCQTKALEMMRSRTRLNAKDAKTVGLATDIDEN